MNDVPGLQQGHSAQKFVKVLLDSLESKWSCVLAGPVVSLKGQFTRQTRDRAKAASKRVAASVPAQRGDGRSGFSVRSGGFFSRAETRNGKRSYAKGSMSALFTAGGRSREADARPENYGFHHHLSFPLQIFSLHRERVMWRPKTKNSPLCVCVPPSRPARRTMRPGYRHSLTFLAGPSGPLKQQ